MVSHTDGHTKWSLVVAQVVAKILVDFDHVCLIGDHMFWKCVVINNKARELVCLGTWELARVYMSSILNLFKSMFKYFIFCNFESYYKSNLKFIIL